MALVFRELSHLWHDKNEAHAELKLPDTIINDAADFLLHPTLLDSGIQLLIAPQNRNNANTDLYLPVQLDELRVFESIDSTEKLYAHVVDHSDDEMLRGDLVLFKENRHVAAAVRGLALQRVGQDTQLNIDDWLYEIDWQQQPNLPKTVNKPAQPGSWLIFNDQRGVGHALYSQLENLGERCWLVQPGDVYQSIEPKQIQLNPTNQADFSQLFKDIFADGQLPLRGIVHLWGAALVAENSLNTFAAAQSLGTTAVLHLIQALNKAELTTSPRLWLVTRGVQAVTGQDFHLAVAQSPLWGLGEVIAHEHPELHCTRIDLSVDSLRNEPELLFAELWSDVENQVALRENGRFAARLSHAKIDAAEQDESAQPKTKALPEQAYAVDIKTPGILASLTLQPVNRPKPMPGQVEIKIQAAGLNFIDVMKAMGIYPGLDPDAPVALGAECAGVITAVSDTDQFNVGDEVIAITPSFDNTSFFGAYATIPVELVVKKPAHLTFAEAAALPVTFLTAYYAMVYLGRLRKGERILIHSATGGVGMAAIQLAQLYGAEIFATAGSPEKRAYLRELGVQHVMDSRTLDFADEIMKITSGAGVDMVLNSLTDEALRKSFAVLGKYGRFLEIGKQDIYQNNALGMEPFKKNLSFFAIDLARITAERPVFINDLFNDLMQLFVEKSLQPLPVKTFPISKISDAFRFMAQAKHIGKIALSMQDDNIILTQPTTKSTRVTADATYLITGGFGGLGLEVAQWLTSQGARHLALVGRSTPSANAQQKLDELAAKGVQIQPVQADITSAEDVANLMQQIRDELPPLRGVIHAAGVLNDGILLQQTPARFAKVVAPKMAGAWNLHTETQELPLDFFVMFSSITTMLGSPGQGNYVAGNAFLDALAHHRRAVGLPALSINWGPWSEVGMAAEQANRGNRLAARGMGSIKPKQGITALEQIFAQDFSQVGVTPLDINKWIENYPMKNPPFYANLQTDSEAEAPSTPKQSGIRDALLAEEPGRRRQSMFESYLREQVAQVLQLAPNRVPLDKPLKTLGVDSLMTLELRNRLESGLDVSLSSTFVWNYPTVSTQAPYLAEKMGISLQAEKQQDDAQEQAEQPAEEEKIAEQLEDISNDEIEQLLSEELGMIDDLLKGL